MGDKCHICVEPILPNVHSSLFKCGSDSTQYSFHQFCLEDVGRIKTENKNLKIERKGLRDVYDALIQRNSITEEICEMKTKECLKKDRLINDLMTFKQEIELVTEQQNERIQSLENELNTYKGDFFNYL